MTRPFSHRKNPTYPLPTVIIEKAAALARVQYREQLAFVLSRCSREGDCWEFAGARKREGYGNFKFRGRYFNTSRFVLLALGVDLEGKDACHSCDNPPCCNPEHLFAGTRQQNILDSKAKGRLAKQDSATSLSWPEQLKRYVLPNLKLGADDIPVIRRRLAAGEKQRNIAVDYGVTLTTISAIKVGKIWGSIRGHE